MPFKPDLKDFPLSDTHKTFDEVVDYILSLGVSKNNIRIIEYRHFLEKISTNGGGKYSPEQTMRLWREIHEIMWVLSVFKDNRLNPPRELIIRAFDGKPLEEYDHEAGRNLFLQLRAAIYFLRVGYGITLNGNCDVIAIRKSKRIFIECKRLYSEKKAQTRVNECFVQLRNRLNDADSKFKNLGIAWIDPSPAMQQHYFAYSAYSEAGARQAARTDLIYFWRKWLSSREKGDKRIFATILQIVWPSWISGTKSIRTGFTSFVLPSHGSLGIFGLFRARRLLDEILSIENIND